MATSKLNNNFKCGDRVKIVPPGVKGRIVELRGPLGPNGIQIYRILLSKKPKRVYTEVREDQLELLGEK
jgi:hypothetical protein